MYHIICFLTLWYSPADIGEQNYLQQYSGSYNIYVTGLGSTEAYALAANGSAVWVNGWKDRYGKIHTQKKYGSWTATRGRISISIKGITGIITEDYKLINGRFVNTEDSDRYLKRT